MSLQNPIADMLTTIKNGQARHHQQVEMPASKLKVAIAQVLCDEGYITDYQVSEGSKPVLTITLKYFNGCPVIDSLRQVSRPSIRRYAGVKELPRVKGGLGVAIVSTSKGLMTDAKARARGLGGEILCEVA